MTKWRNFAKSGHSADIFATHSMDCTLLQFSVGFGELELTSITVILRQIGSYEKVPGFFTSNLDHWSRK